MVTALGLDPSGPPPEAGERNDDAELLGTLDDFDGRCRLRCDDRATTEEVACLEAAQTVADVSACP